MPANRYNNLDQEKLLLDYFNQKPLIHIPKIRIDWFTNISDLVRNQYGCIVESFEKAKLEYNSLILGKSTLKWNVCNFSSLEYHLQFGHKKSFFSTSIMSYINPISQWRRCFRILKCIFSNRFASALFVGTKKIGNLSDIFYDTNTTSEDNFFHGIDSWYGGFLSNLYNIYKLPHQIINLKKNVIFRKKRSFRFYIKTFRRPSCIIVLRYGESAYHSDIEAFKYKIPLFAIADTDSKPSGFSKAMYVIPSCSYNLNMITTNLMTFIYIFRHLRYKRLETELSILNTHFEDFNSEKEISDKNERIALHTLALDFKALQKDTELVKIEAIAIKVKEYYRDIKIQNINFYSSIRIFLQVLTIITLALAIKGQGLVNYYYKTIFLFKKKKFTQFLIKMDYLLQKFSKKKTYKLSYQRLIAEKNLVFLNYFTKISDVASRKSWLKNYIGKFRNNIYTKIGNNVLLRYTKLKIGAQLVRAKLYLNNRKNPSLNVQKTNQLPTKHTLNIITLFMFKYRNVMRTYKKFFYTQARKIRKLMVKRYFRFQFKRKLKIIQIKKFKQLSGFLAPRKYVDTEIWKRLSVEQLMAKRRAALYFQKPKQMVFKKKSKFSTRAKGFKRKTYSRSNYVQLKGHKKTYSKSSNVRSNVQQKTYPKSNDVRSNVQQKTYSKSNDVRPNVQQKTYPKSNDVRPNVQQKTYPKSTNVRSNVQQKTYPKSTNVRSNVQQKTYSKSNDVRSNVQQKTYPKSNDVRSNVQQKTYPKSNDVRSNVQQKTYSKSNDVRPNVQQKTYPKSNDVRPNVQQKTYPKSTNVRSNVQQKTYPKSTNVRSNVQQKTYSKSNDVRSNVQQKTYPKSNDVRSNVQQKTYSKSNDVRSNVQQKTYPKSTNVRSNVQQKTYSKSNDVRSNVQQKTYSKSNDVRPNVQQKTYPKSTNVRSKVTYGPVIANKKKENYVSSSDVNIRKKDSVDVVQKNVSKNIELLKPNDTKKIIKK